MDREIAHDDVVGPRLQKNGAGVSAVSVLHFKTGELHISASIQPEHGGTVLVLIVPVEPRSVKDHLFAGRGSDRDIGVLPALHTAVETDLAAVYTAPQIESVAGSEHIDDALYIIRRTGIIDLPLSGRRCDSRLYNLARMRLKGLVPAQIIFVFPRSGGFGPG